MSCSNCIKLLIEKNYTIQSLCTEYKPSYKLYNKHNIAKSSSLEAN